MTFQSTLLMRGATSCHLATTGTAVYFNPRSSCEERLLVTSPRQVLPCISIHAPHVRSDDGTVPERVPVFYFNPRSSCEERPRAALEHPQLCDDFNPRSSCEERQPSGYLRSSTCQFQSTLLMRGATAWMSGGKDTGLFQSTLLMRGATAGKSATRPIPLFQSTLLMRGATRT